MWNKNFAISGLGLLLSLSAYSAQVELNVLDQIELDSAQFIQSLKPASPVGSSIAPAILYLPEENPKLQELWIELSNLVSKVEFKGPLESFSSNKQIILNNLKITKWALYISERPLDTRAWSFDFEETRITLSLEQFTVQNLFEIFVHELAMRLDGKQVPWFRFILKA
jgi:hypothetical protein